MKPCAAVPIIFFQFQKTICGGLHLVQNSESVTQEFEALKRL